MEARAEKIANVTYIAPTETGEVQVISGLDAQGQALPTDLFVRVGRNDPCPCGSGKKFKMCHGKLS